MTKRRDFIGEQFGRWTVLAYSGGRYWRCRCECGNVVAVYGGSLTEGRSTQCNRCRGKTGTRHTHRGRRTRLYTIWSRMIGRCENPNDPAYPRYGGRGISICRAWRRDFATFRAWALANGYQHHLTLDRRENDRGYEPGNCRWATYKQQNRNRRNNRRVVYQDREITVAELADLTGIAYDTLKQRLGRYGWSVARATAKRNIDSR